MAFPDRVPMSSALIHVTETLGHHQSYLELFGRLFGLSPSVGRIGPRLFWRLSKARHVFFGTLDDDLVGFIAVAVMRAFLGKRTGGLFLHPNTCIGLGAKARLKRLIFSALCRLNGVSVISILPFELMPGMEQVATHSVHDPQFWDQLDAVPEVDQEMVRRIGSLAGGRPVLAYLGWATQAKGFPFLAGLAGSNPELTRDLLIVAAGRVNEDCRAEAEALEKAGGVVWDRFVSDAELAALYEASDLIWVCYAPGYDQASGIFGRAVQNGRRPVIRDTAVTIGHYAALLDIPSVALSGDDVAGSAGLLIETARKADPFNAPTPTLRRWKQEFIDTVRGSL